MDSNTPTTKKRTFRAPKGYYTKDQTADLLGISNRSLERRMTEMFDETETIRFMGRRIFQMSTVDTYIQNYIKENS